MGKVEEYKARIEAATARYYEGNYSRDLEEYEAEQSRQYRKNKRLSEEPSEHQEQSEVCKWLRARRLVFFSVPNGAVLNRSRGQAQRMRDIAYYKAEGFRPGAPDLLIFSKPNTGHDGVALEMKKAKGGVVSSNQMDCGRDLEGCNWLYLVGHGGSDAVGKRVEVYG